MTPHARCPECSRKVATETVDGRLVFVRHSAGPGRWPRSDGSPTCEGSRYLVEDDELIEAGA